MARVGPADRRPLPLVPHGLRALARRNRDSVARCLECRRGEVVLRETYRDWWLERFSAEECAAMALAI